MSESTQEEFNKDINSCSTSYKKKAGRRRLRQWSSCSTMVHVATVTSTIVLSLSSVIVVCSAFQAVVPPPQPTSSGTSSNTRRPKKQQWNTERPPFTDQQRRTELGVSSTLLLEQTNTEDHARPDPPTELYYVSNYNKMNRVVSSRQPAATLQPEDAETTKNNKMVRFKGVTMTPPSAAIVTKKKKKRSTAGTGPPPSSSSSSSMRLTTSSSSTSTSKKKSSTMSGFATETKAQKQYREGLRLVEQRTGKKIRDSPEASRRRRKLNGEAMYLKSKSVPDSMVAFAEEIHREDRISHDQEIELGEKTQEAIRLQMLFDNLENKLNREPTDDEWCAAAGKINMEMIQQTIAEGLEAKNKLVTSNLRMVQSVVNTYIRNGMTAQYNAGDMMQEGIMALIRAAEKFEPDRGWKFSTYAMYWVRASVKRSQIYQSRAIPVPPRLYENHKRLLRVEKDLTLNLGRRPTKLEIGQAVGMSELQVHRCFKAMNQKCYSLDQAIHNTLKPNERSSGRGTLIDLVDSRVDDGEHSRLERVLLRDDLIAALHRYLDPQEVELLLLRYGLKDVSSTTGRPGRQLTIAELSRIVGINPDRCRRMIDKSIKQIQQSGGEEWLVFERELQ